jgi:hypothetical protein
MHTRTISLLVLASVSLGANIQVPLGGIHPEAFGGTFAQIEPSLYVGNELKETCTTLRSNLTQEEIDVCDYFSEQNSFSQGYGAYQLDFVAHICGYKADSESIPYTVSNDSDWAFTIPRLGPGVLYDRFALDHFKGFGVIGKWQEVQRTLYCLKEQKDTITKHIEYVMKNYVRTAYLHSRLSVE